MGLAPRAVVVGRLLLPLTLLPAACSPDEASMPQAEATAIVESGPIPPSAMENLERIWSDLLFLSRGSLSRISESGDLRLGWALVDLLRFHEGGENDQRIVDQLVKMTGKVPSSSFVRWVYYTDLLLRRDVPAFPGYLGLKRRLYLETGPRWRPFFDPDARLDWRLVTWGGVLRDRIPALVDPPVIPAAKGDWLPDDDLVFGVVSGGEARAYPERVMEVHELVNDSLGGRRIAIPYCTLCRAAIAYRTDRAPFGPLELRTSGLLQRSNKLMYDVQTESLFDQFDGVALSGPQLDRGTRLPRVPLITTTWGEWKAAHPRTTVIAEGAGTGREYTGDFLGDRDAGGPIFPTGPRDRRLPAQEIVFGVETPRGVTVAFPVDEARATLATGRPVIHGGVELSLRAGGLVAHQGGRGPDLRGNEAYWFAWSQFRPGTLLWSEA
jgi:hypothetical protein